MKNVYGKINIQALAGCANVQTRGEFEGAGFATEPRASSYITTLNLDAKV